MIKTPKYTIIFLCSQPVAFCTKSKVLVAGPFIPDTSCSIATDDTTHKYIEKPKADLDANSLATITEIINSINNRGAIPVFICDKLQGDALTTLYPSAIILYPAELITTSNGKAAPGILTNSNLSDEDATELLSALGY